MWYQAALRGVGRVQLTQQQLPPFLLKQCEKVNIVVSHELSTSSILHNHPSYWKVPKGNIKKRYLRKYPLVHTSKDGAVTVEGVSDKQNPLPIAVWKDPGKVERFRPGEHGSGDLGNVESLVPESLLHKSRPRLEFESSKELLESPEDVKRVSFNPTIAHSRGLHNQDNIPSPFRVFLNKIFSLNL